MQLEGFKEPKHREPKEDDEDKFASLYCPVCQLMATPDNVEGEAEDMVDFIIEHQKHGEVCLMVEEDDGWEQVATLHLPQ
jgi:hypothetical protein